MTKGASKGDDKMPHKVMRCGKCGSIICHCPECGYQYYHSKKSNGHCSKPVCKEVNAPLDCDGCGFVVSSDGQGVLDYDMNLIVWTK